MLKSEWPTAAAVLAASLMLAAPAALADKGGNGNGNAAAHGASGSNGNGAAASAMGALNAAHASPVALAHAAPTSRVGKIAAYKAVETAAQDAAGFDAAMASQSAELQTAYASFQAGTMTATDFRALIESDTTLTAQFDSWQQDAATAAATGQTDPAAALAAASNKPVDATVQANVDSLLSR